MKVAVVADCEEIDEVDSCCGVGESFDLSGIIEILGRVDCIEHSTSGEGDLEAVAEKSFIIAMVVSPVACATLCSTK